MSKRSSVGTGIHLRSSSKPSTEQMSKTDDNIRERKEFYNLILDHLHTIQCSFWRFGYHKEYNHYFIFPHRQLQYELNYYLVYHCHPTSQEIEAWKGPALQRHSEHRAHWFKCHHDIWLGFPIASDKPKPRKTFLIMIKTILQWKRIKTHQRKRIGPCNEHQKQQIVIKFQPTDVILDIFQRAHLNKHIDKDKESVFYHNVILDIFQRAHLNKNIDKFIKSILQRKMRVSRLTRKTSLHISTQRLDAHLTVRIKLERLKEYQRKLEQNVPKANSSPTAPNDFAQRLKFLEEFLHGFGVVIDSIPTNVSMEDYDSTDRFKLEKSRATGLADTPISALNTAADYYAENMTYRNYPTPVEYNTDPNFGVSIGYEIATCIHDRKQPHNKEYVSLISLANQCILDLVMKLSEAQLRPFYTGLSESEEQNLNSSIERRFPFWKMSIALSMHLKHQLSAAHRYDKFDSHKNWKMLRALQLSLLFLKSTLKTDAFKGGNWTRVDNNQRYYLNLSPFTKLLKLALDENRDKINILRYNKYYDKDTTLGRKRNYNNSADTFTKALPRTLFYKHSVISWDVYHHLITKEVCQYVPKTQTRLS